MVSGNSGIRFWTWGLPGASLVLLMVSVTNTVSAAKDPGLLESEKPCLRLTSRIVSTDQPGFYNAIYADRKDGRLLSPTKVSEDNGVSWDPLVWKPDFTEGLPNGYRRAPLTAVRDSNAGAIMMVCNAMDTPGLNPLVKEPPIAQKSYYLRYRVSMDGGRSWLFDEPIIQTGSFNSGHPVEGVWVGKNAIYLGDLGCIPLITRRGTVLLPAQTTPLAPDGSLWNPGGGHTYTEVVVLLGTWGKKGRIRWTASARVSGDPRLTTRGLIEPTLAEFPKGRILMVMRGSNGGKADPKEQLPSHKWFAVSHDDGQTWSKTEPWTYDDGSSFFSPSSMSRLITHSSGRCFWVGNITPENCAGNLPRWPLVIGEVEPKSLRLMRQSLVVVDSEQPGDAAQGRLDISHVTALEDRQTHEIILTYPRAHNAYKSSEWITARYELEK